MKFLNILAAASLALAPAIASAGSSSDSTDSTDNGRPIAGPLAGRVLDDSAVPVGAIILGGLVILGGAVIAILGGSDSNNNTND
jgi:hypothetical protein